MKKLLGVGRNRKKGFGKPGGEPQKNGKRGNRTYGRARRYWGCLPEGKLRKEGGPIDVQPF